MQPISEGSGDSEMKSQENIDEESFIDLERYRNLVRTFIDLVSIKHKKKKPISIIDLNTNGFIYLATV